MKLFESSYQKDWDSYERYYDTELNKSVSKKIQLPSEWFEEYSQGEFTSLLDENIRLKRVQGKAKDGRDNYSFVDPIYRNIRDNYWKNQSYNKSPRTWFLDTETFVGKKSKGFPVPEKALESVNLIQIYDSELDTMIVLGLRDWVHQSSYNFNYKVQYIKCKNEIELFEKYFKIFNKLNPLIIYAWNGEGFDFPYLYNRCKLLGIDTNKFSNYNSAKLTTKNVNNKLVFNFKADGHYYIDMMVVYKKFVFKPRDSYSLDSIAEAELKKKKVNHSEYQKFQDFYDGNYTIPENPTEEQKNSKIYQEAIKGNIDEVKELAHSDFVYYGITDTYLIKELDKKLNFTSLLLMISEKMGVHIDDAMGTVKPWSQYMLNRSYENKKAIPPRQHTDESVSIVGGFVRDPIVGKHKWVMSADVSSMYPLLGMTGYNMSPETYIPIHKLPNDLREVILRYWNNENEAERLELSQDVKDLTTSLLKKYNYSMGINGAVFNNNNGQGMLPTMILDIYSSRKKAKQTMFKYEQRAVIIKDILSHNAYKGISDLDKDVLKYTEDELKELNEDKLKELLKTAEDLESLYNTKQLIEKLLINGVYGAFATPYFPLFNQNMARAITGNGRYFIQKLAKYIDDSLQKMIEWDKSYISYGDTDSVYFSIEPFVEKAFKNKLDATIMDKVNFCDNFYKKVVEPIVQKCIEDFANELNAFNPDVIGCDREAIADAMVFVAKKKYFARVLDNEGTRYTLDNPYYKKMGLEVIKSSTPLYSRKYLEKAIPLILDLTEDELSKWIQERREEYTKQTPGDIASTGGISNMDYKLDTPGVPIGVRSALVHNKYIKENNLLDKYTEIQAGDKTKRLYLTEPNPLNSNIVAFLDEAFMEEFKEYIDYDTNFEKGFMSPLNIMVNALNWNLNKSVESLEDW